MKKLFLVINTVLLAFGLLALASAEKAGTSNQLNATGWIGDQRCSAKLAKAGTVTDSDVKCVKACIGRGEKVVFIDEKDKTVTLVSNPEAVKDYAGQHVTVRGSMVDNMLRVDGVTAAAN